MSFWSFHLRHLIYIRNVPFACLTKKNFHQIFYSYGNLIRLIY